MPHRYYHADTSSSALSLKKGLTKDKIILVTVKILWLALQESVSDWKPCPWKFGVKRYRGR